MTQRFILWPAVLVAAAVGGWSVGRQFSRPTHPISPTTIPWGDSLYEAHTSFVEGPLLPRTTAKLTSRIGEGPAVVVVLDNVDLRNCGDLGRQLRELRRALIAEIPFLFATSAESADELAHFLRSERLGSAISDTIDLGSILSLQDSLSTPAVVWLDKDLTYGFGVGHKLRHPYVRPRSFAQELAPHYQKLFSSRHEGRYSEGYAGETSFESKVQQRRVGG